jgi:hypothetical protein
VGEPEAARLGAGATAVVTRKRIVPTTNRSSTSQITCQRQFFYARLRQVLEGIHDALGVIEEIKAPVVAGGFWSYGDKIVTDLLVQPPIQFHNPIHSSIQCNLPPLPRHSQHRAPSHPDYWALLIAPE